MEEKSVQKIFSKYLLGVVVFVSGGVVMIFELVGSRITGPYVGTSTYAWTSLIGVILASLSLGYYLGGKLADKRPDTLPLAIIIAISGLLIAISTFFKDIIPSIISSYPLSLETKSILISLILFAPASLFLGMISPYAVRLKMNTVENAGKTAGNLYALSTMGSIVGTFLAGFYIIPHFGSAKSLMILTIILFILSIILLGKNILKISTLFFLTFTIFVSTFSLVSGEIIAREKMFVKNLIIDKDTEYNRIWIYDFIDTNTKKPARALSTDLFGIQGAVFTDGTEDLVFNYTKFYRLAEFFFPNIKSALTIGGCAYTQPQDFLKRNPESVIDVVEIDPGMTEVAKEYFGLKDDTRLNIIHEDGRIFLNKRLKKYDAIFIDAFNGAASVPFNLTTKETARAVFESLNDEGVVMMNIISSIEGEKGKFLRAEYATYSEVFPQVYIFQVEKSINSNDVQNIMLVALKNSKKPSFLSNNKEISKQLSNLWKKPIENDTPVLTDDFVPVEFYKKLSL